jgi:L-fuconolactonase
MSCGRSLKGQALHPVIDTHLHVWHRSPGHYGWLKPEFGELYDDFPAERVEPDVMSSGVTGAILVQADDTIADSEAMFDASDRYDWIVGVVAWVPLDQPSVAESQLEQWLEHPAFCGIRQLVHDDPRPHVYSLPEVRHTASLLGQAGIPLDIPDAWPRDLGQVVDLASDVSELTVVLDHAGKPPVGRDDVDSWLDTFARLASRENTVVKFSGLHHPERDFSLSGAMAIWEACLDHFGPTRMMVGSDWPITQPYGGYRPTWHTMTQFLSTLSDEERADVSWRTAARVYGQSSRLSSLHTNGGS